jgi:hypothetical protein
MDLRYGSLLQNFYARGEIGLDYIELLAPETGRDYQV